MYSLPSCPQEVCHLKLADNTRTRSVHEACVRECPLEEKKEIVFLTSTFTVTVAFAAPDGEQVKSPESVIVSLVTCEEIVAEKAYHQVILIMYSGDGDRQAGGRAPFLELLFQLQSPAVHRKVQWLAGNVPELRFFVIVLKHFQQQWRRAVTK